MLSSLHFVQNILKMNYKAVDESSDSRSYKSIFSDWSPLPERKLFTPEIDQISTEDTKELFPNCDANVWLRSCDKEIPHPLEGTITGKIPRWLSGSLLRNGPGSLKVADMEFKHIFDSSALLHRVSAIFDLSNQSDNAMISVYPFGDELYAFTESPVIHKVNRITLETEQKTDISQYVSIINHTSHPHVLEDGSVYNLGTSVTKTGLVHNIIKFPNTDKNMFQEAKIVASVPVRWPLHPSYMHTFGITKNYFIMVEQPLSISIPSFFMSKIKNNPMVANFRWYKDEPTQIHVISRETGQTAFKFFSESFFFFHIINQYEVSDHIVLDICCYRDPSMLDCMYVEVMKNMQSIPNYVKMFRGRPLRFVLPLKFEENQENLISLPNTTAEAFRSSNGNVFVEPELLCNLGCETPRINHGKYLGKEYRYFYAISSDVDSENLGSIIKVDTQNKTALTWFEDNCYPSEPIFVPNPDSKTEDDGIILSAMVWGKKYTNRVGLLILDAKTMEEIGRVVFETPSEVPKCLHGWFCKDESEK